MNFKNQLTKLQSDRIQIIRGICIYCVCLGHSSSWTTMEYYVMPFCHSCVGVFLFLSGLLTSYEMGDLSDFYKKRLSRIFFPYLIWSVIYTLVDGNYQAFLWNFVTGQCCSVYYYILAYFELTLLTPWIIRLAKSRIFWIGYLITPLAVLIIYLSYYVNAPITYPYNINTFFVWFLYYFLGLRMGNREECVCPENGQTDLPKGNAEIEKKSSHEMKKSLMISIILWLICLVLEYAEADIWKQADHWDMANTQVKITALMTATALCFVYFSLINKSEGRQLPAKVKAIAIALGNASFGIYLVHQLLIKLYGKTVYWETMNVFLRSILVIFGSFLLVKILQLLLPKKWHRLLGVS